MSADLHIHVLTDNITEEEFRAFNSPLTLGGPFDNSKVWNSAYGHIAETPNIWIGEVSWLKAALFDDSDTFVPDTVGQIQDIIGHSPMLLTEEKLQAILSAFNSTNTTSYDIARRDEVEQFLRPHLGKEIFTVSW